MGSPWVSVAVSEGSIEKALLVSFVKVYNASPAREGRPKLTTSRCWVEIAGRQCIQCGLSARTTAPSDGGGDDVRVHPDHTTPSIARYAQLGAKAAFGVVFSEAL